MNNMESQFNICMITSYPTTRHPNLGIFVHNLATEMKRLGAQIHVISPTSMVRALFRRVGDELPDAVSIQRLKYFSISSRTVPWGKFVFWMNLHQLKKSLKNMKLDFDKPDLIYAHFFPMGCAAQELAKRLNVPCIVAWGESRYKHYEHFLGVSLIREYVSKFDGIITVNSEIRDRLVNRYGALKNRVALFPNGVDINRFKPLDKFECRKKLGLPHDRFIVIYVGAFNEEKGINKVLKNLKKPKNISAIFLGGGPIKPKGEQVLFSGIVENAKVPLFMGASDIFVLPTIMEGSSNAILEAMACGLPVISSDRPFNYDILDESVSILVDPMDVEALGKAISTLIDDPERRARMSTAARQRALKFSLTERARRILDWLTQAVNDLK